MKTLILYFHGKGGSPAEAEHYVPLFPDCYVLGLDYTAKTPWDAVLEFPPLFDRRAAGYDRVILVANSIGAFFALHSLGEKPIDKAFLISPVVDMEGLIQNMLSGVNATESDLAARRLIPTPFGETLSYDYLMWVRNHPITWRIPTEILYGENDTLQSLASIRSFAINTGAGVTVMEKGEHWFHTEAEMRFLDRWIREKNK